MSILDKFRFKKTSTFIEKATEAECESAKGVAKDRVAAALTTYQDADDDARNYYRSFEPEIGVEVIGGKTFLSIGDVEFCANYVSEIKVAETGRKPSARSGYELYEGTNAYVYPAVPALIKIIYVSGRETDIVCNRHIVDYVFDRLLTAHRDALRKVDR